MTTKQFMGFQREFSQASDRHLQAQYATRKGQSKGSQHRKYLTAMIAAELLRRRVKQSWEQAGPRHASNKAE